MNTPVPARPASSRPAARRQVPSRTGPARRAPARPVPPRDVSLIDLLDRLLAGGVVIHGHITLAAAEIDLVQLDLAVLLAAVDKAMSR